MKNIDNILQEIYKIDSSLKSKEAELKKIINFILESKPDVEINQEFINDLKNKLIGQFKPKPLGWFNAFNYKLAGSLIAIIVIAAAANLLISQFYQGNPLPEGKIIVKNQDGSVIIKTDDGGIMTKESAGGKIIAGFVKFSSEAEYKKYLENSEQNYYYGVGGGGEMAIDAMDMERTKTMALPDSAQNIAPAADRVSQTNVQVQGIDEPDILKTDGKEIYFSSSENRYYIEPMPMIDVETKSIMPPDYNQPKTHLIKAYPAQDLSQDSIIDKTGNLLLSDNILIVFEQRNIYGYDVSDPKKPSKKWTVELDEKNTLVQARLYGDKIYLITSTQASRYNPCVVPLFKAEGQQIAVACQDIYHPTMALATNINYHIATIDPGSGAMKKGVSFLGSYDSTIYMSKENIYVAYSYQGDYIKLMYELCKENSDLIPATVTDKIAKLLTYDISASSKQREYEVIFQDYLNSLSNDEQLKVQNEMQNRSADFFKERKRDLLKTDIVKINIKDFVINAMGTVPGQLLNQFSMDEYDGYLRLATTVGNGWFGFGSSIDQENDIYVLDKNLSLAGSIKGLGLDEKIYSARFIEDKGYLVTFRQTDPFYVLDLSNPAKPQMKGELKIPGYSAYLHPISKDRILGIGKEDSKVKVSLFDVADVSNPKEAAKYILDEYWSDILNTHHAFLLDSQHQVFFMPGSRGGYVFSYQGDKLSLKKAVSDISAKRALFINDYLYIVGDDKIVVLDENTWEQVNKLEIEN